jgi:hypothetical protein
LVLNNGYCINIKQQDPTTGAKTNKNVNSKDYYAYRLMISFIYYILLLLILIIYHVHIKSKMAGGSHLYYYLAKIQYIVMTSQHEFSGKN